MPLYRVKVTYETVVVAGSESSADYKATQLDLTDETPRVAADEILSESDLPPGWTPNCVPYGGDDDTTIKGHLKQLKV